MCRRREGAQPGSYPKLTSAYIPYLRPPAQFIKRGWPGGRSAPFSFFFLFFWEFKLFCEVSPFWKFHEVCEFRVPWISDWLWISHQVVRKNCIVHCLFCIFIIIISFITIITTTTTTITTFIVVIIIIIIILVISMYFVVLLNCLYPRPGDLSFVYSSPNPTVGEGEGWASGSLVLSYWLLG